MRRWGIIPSLLLLTVSSAINDQRPLLSDFAYEIGSDHTNVLDVFQIYKPPFQPSSSGEPCTLLLMQHVFGWIYGLPFVGNYSPPACDFNSVTINLTTTSTGRQFDRLGLMYLGDVEVFRTSTAEPTPNGIIWTYIKDMSPYLALWKRPQKLIFDMGNLIDSTYTGSFNITLTATFFTKSEAPVTADLILPISAQRSHLNAPSAFIVPADDTTAIHSIPSAGVKRATVSISACGQATEEFWYSNVLSSDTETFKNTTGELYGHSPFREVQLLIDGMLAGVLWPFPIIFTGGIAPGLWRPIVGIDVFDLREPEIDISSFLPYLSDGKPHQFQLKILGLDALVGPGGLVSGADADGRQELSEQIGSYWVLTGKVFLFFDDVHPLEDKAPPKLLRSNFRCTTRSRVEKNADGTNETLSYSINVSRSFTVVSSTGYWSQALRFSNRGTSTAQGLTQLNVQHTIGHSDFLVHTAPAPVLSSSTDFKYPIRVKTTFGIFPNGSGIYIDATLGRGMTLLSDGRPDVSLYTLASGPSWMTSWQEGSAHYSSRTNASYSFGTTQQKFSEDSYGKRYDRDVRAVNGTVMKDSAQQDANKGKAVISGEASVSSSPSGFGAVSVRSMLGRGPGRPGELRKREYMSGP